MTAGSAPPEVPYGYTPGGKDNGVVKSKGKPTLHLVEGQEVVPMRSRLLFRRFVVQLFGLRRKQLLGSLRQVTMRSADEIRTALTLAEARPEQRAETLSPQQFWQLARALVDGAEREC